MDYKVVWMDEAIADLKPIVLRIACENSDAALRWGEKPKKPLALSRHSRFGRMFGKLARDDGHELNMLPYRIIYYIRDATWTVWILTVWHGAREEPDVSVP